MAHVSHLFRAPQRRLPMEELEQIRALEDSGLEGCAHARTGSPRQVLLVDSETLELMDLQPGIIRENITTCEINVNGLPVGQRLRLGEAQLEVSVACSPLRFTGKNQAWSAARTARPARDVVPRDRRRDDSARRQHRKNSLAVWGSGFPEQARRIRRPVLVFFALLGPFHRLVRRNNPVEPVLFFHFRQDE